MFCLTYRLWHCGVEGGVELRRSSVGSDRLTAQGSPGLCQLLERSHQKISSTEQVNGCWEIRGIQRQTFVITYLLAFRWWSYVLFQLKFTKLLAIFIFILATEFQCLFDYRNSSSLVSKEPTWNPAQLK